MKKNKGIKDAKFRHMTLGCREKGKGLRRVTPRFSKEMVIFFSLN